MANIVTTEIWSAACEQLAFGSKSLLSLWGCPDFVYMALLSNNKREIEVIALPCPKGSFPSVAKFHPPAQRLERTVTDLFGLKVNDAPDSRPWLDHGKWGLIAPMGRSLAEIGKATAPYEFLASEGESLHQIPVGPVHAGIIEPGHFRFTANGETIVRLEARLGYTHKGVEKLMNGADLETASKLAGRTSGDSTAAYQLAFARAVEDAAEIEIPVRAHWLRGLIAELERIANHIGDIGAVCNDAAFALMPAHCGVLRERILRASDECFGHRLMMDFIVPGGVTANIGERKIVILRDLISNIKKNFLPLIDLYDNTPSLQDRTVSTGILSSELAMEYAAGGYVGRGSGRDFDARRALGYPPYNSINFEVPVREEGDVNARVWIRILEVEQSLSLISQILDGLPEGDIFSPITIKEKCEGLALIEGFRGDVLVWLQIDAKGQITRCHMRDPSWFQWPLLESAVDKNIVADFPICNKSFNCSYSGQDL